MPKIHPETKVLIIKRLKTRSTAEVADTFNVSQHQVQRIEIGDVFWQAQVRQTPQDNRSGGPFVGSKIQGQPLFRCSRAPQELVTWSPHVNQNSLSNSVSKWPPWLNQCLETSTEQKTTKAHSLPKGWMLEKWQKVDFSDESSVELHHSRRKYFRRPTGACMDPRFTQKTVKFGGGKIMAWGYIQYGGVREICRVEGNINSLKYQEVLPLTFPTIKGAKFCSRMVLLRILPSLHQSSSRRRRSRCSRIGQPSHQTWTSLSMSGVGWKRKHGRWNQRNLMNSGRHARLLSLLFLMTSSINCMNPCQTAWIQSFKLMEVMQDIKFGSHSTTT